MDKRGTSPFFEERKVRHCIHIQSVRNYSPVKEIMYELLVHMKDYVLKKKPVVKLDVVLLKTYYV